MYVGGKGSAQQPPAPKHGPSSPTNVTKTAIFCAISDLSISPVAPVGPLDVRNLLGHPVGINFPDFIMKYAGAAGDCVARRWP